MEPSPIDAASSSSSLPFAKWRSDVFRRFQHFPDRSTPHPTGRWMGTLGIASVYALMVYSVQGFHVVSYALGIYLLNLLIGFLSPVFDPELEGMGGASLPTRGSDEFKPFVRRIPDVMSLNSKVKSSVFSNNSQYQTLWCIREPSVTSSIVFPLH